MRSDRSLTDPAPAPEPAPAVGRATDPSVAAGIHPTSAGSAPPRRRRFWPAYVLGLVLTAAISVGATLWAVRDPAQPEWRQVYREDFSTDVAVGQFPGTVYGDRASVYPDGWADTSGRGRYRPSQVLSVAGGSLRWDMHTAGGTPLGAAVLPTLPTYGQIYGRYSVRFRADPVPGFGLAFLLWPDSEKWPRDGEIDFPEGELSEGISAFAHHATPAGTTDVFQSGASFHEWHVATIEWRPDSVRFLLDGREIGASITDVPSRSMHWVLQTGTHGDAPPAPSARARIEIDWLEAEAWR